jgi:hypothetical protein
MRRCAIATPIVGRLLEEEEARQGSNRAAGVPPMGMGAGNGQRPFAILVQAVAGEALNGQAESSRAESTATPAAMNGRIWALNWENVNGCKPG